MKRYQTTRAERALFSGPRRWLLGHLLRLAQVIDPRLAPPQWPEEVLQVERAARALPQRGATWVGRIDGEVCILTVPVDWPAYLQRIDPEYEQWLREWLNGDDRRLLLNFKRRATEGAKR